MDYKYIKQLLERYWNCETSLEEEDILRTFFSQEDIPSELESYKALFTYELGESKNEALGDDFDEKMMDIIEGEELSESVLRRRNRRFLHNLQIPVDFGHHADF